MNINQKLPGLIIWGASGHAMVVADIVRLQRNFEIIGFLDDVNLDRHRAEFCGAPILGGVDELDLLKKEGIYHVILGFGNCPMRFKLSQSLTDKGFVLPVAVHPKATIAADCELGPGTVVAAGSVINSGSKIGTSVIINTLASVDHECVIADAAHICPGVRLGGRVKVGEATHVGIGTTVRDGVSIGNNSIIGAGSVVVQDIPDNVVAYGVPAHVVKRNELL